MVDLEDLVDLVDAVMVLKMTSKNESAERWRELHNEALRLAQRLRSASVVFRRYAGELKYHPQTGIQGRVGPDLHDAALVLRGTLAAIAAVAAGWDEEVGWLRSRDPQAPVDEVQRAHDAAREGVRLARAALDVFEQAALHPEPASLDAPYGHGAPRRVHPGAQCTWVAERAEELAVALSSVTLRKENLLLALGV